MKKILFFIVSIVCANLMAYATPNQSNNTLKSAGNTYSFPEYVKQIRTSKSVNSDSPATPQFYAVCHDAGRNNKATRSDMVTIYPELLNGMASVTAVSHNGDVYNTELNFETWEYALTLPEGIYDLISFGYDGDANVLVLCEYNVNLNSDSTIVFDGNDACYTTTLKYYSPTGEELRFPSSTDAQDGNCFRSTEFIMFLYNNICLSLTPKFRNDNRDNNIKSNFKEGPFNVNVLASITSTEGILNFTLSVDLSLSEIGNTSAGWQSIETSFAPTPENKVYQNFIGTSDNLTNHGYTECLILYNNMWLISGGGYIDENFDHAEKTWFWKSDNYSGPFDIGSYPMSSMMFNSPECVIEGLPLMAGDKNPVQLGVNYADGMDLIMNTSFPIVKSVFPYYENIGSKITLGNCAPMLTNFPKNESSFKYGFTGRHGEIFKVDTWFNDEELCNPEIVTTVGFPTSTVKVSFDGTLLSDNRSDFPDEIDWSKRGVYEIEVETDNVLINDEVRGKTKGSVTFDTRKNDKTIPTVSAFQVVNKDNEEVTDILENPRDGFIRLFAGDFKSKLNEEYYYFYWDITEVETVTVEYSPAGDGEYQPLDVTKGDLFITPGFGREYTADLSKIDRTGLGGWFDIRITVEDSKGSKQVQEICPALNISSMSGIEVITADDDAEVEYYNLQGLRINKPEAGTLVIVRKGTETRKALIK